MSIDKLWDLLPSYVQIAHGAGTQPSLLATLLGAIDEQVAQLYESHEQLYDDLFIETCAPWVVPYIGELIGSEAIHEIPGIRGRRADVARTIHYRRRKGTRLALEGVARDVTGWSALVVPFFERLLWTQNLNHLRLFSAGDRDVGSARFTGPATVDLRDAIALERLGSAFDRLGRTVTLRPATQNGGFHELRRVIIFLWRLEADRLHGVVARPSQSAVWGTPTGSVSFGYHLSPLGAPLPLFQSPAATLADDAEIGPRDVRAPMASAVFAEELAQWHEARAPLHPIYGENLSLYIEGRVLPPRYLECLTLDVWKRPRPGAQRSGLRSRNLGTFSGLSASNPALTLSVLGMDVKVSLAGPSNTLAAVRTTLEAALRSARASDGRAPFSDFEVLVVDARLLLLGGPPGQASSASGAGADTTTFNELGLGAGSSMIWCTRARAAYSPLPAQPHGRSVGARVNGGPVQKVDVSALGATASAAASTLELELRATGAPELGAARVVSANGRLYALASDPSLPLAFGPTSEDENSAAELWLESRLGIDVTRGRISFDFGAEPRGGAPVLADFERGIGMRIGGGGYSWAEPALDEGAWHAQVRLGAPASGSLFGTLDDALQAFASGSQSSGVITIMDSATHRVSGDFRLAAHRQLVVRAEREHWPHLLPEQGNALKVASSGAENARLELRGLLLDGGLELGAGVLEDLVLLHTTLVPGRGLDETGKPRFPDAASLVVPAGNPTLRVRLEACITGPLAVHPDVDSLTLSDCIVDRTSDGVSVAGDAAGSDDAPPLTVTRCTMFGATRALGVDLASDSIFFGALALRRTQSGCLRFCWLPLASRAPAPYRCQPQLALETATGESAAALEQRLAPVFASARYGEPAYAELAVDCPREVREGASSGSEMGAFSALLQPQREANLRLRLQEHLPRGLEASLAFLT